MKRGRIAVFGEVCATQRGSSDTANKGESARDSAALEHPERSLLSPNTPDLLVIRGPERARAEHFYCPRRCVRGLGILLLVQA
jgi:hypothetical protein